MSDFASEISLFYRGRSVFITGASGFIGKVLVEKLLRSCPDISKIYVLIRPKKGQDVDERLQTLLNVKLFDPIRKSNPDLLKKIHPITGDIRQPNLGISEKDATLLQENVSVIFHSAATVRFDEPLKVATLTNVTGTKYVTQLAKKLNNLAAVMHVSTAYAHCDRKVLDEVLYPPPVDPEKFMPWLNSADDNLVNQLTPEILGKRPNTYTFTKAIAETVFAEECAHLPAAIVRPSIVASSRKEPFPGWLDNLNGPGGMTVGIGKGVIRTVPGNPESICAFIPVDVFVNAMIAIAWRTATTQSKISEILVFNCTGSMENPMRQKHYHKMMLQNCFKKPFKEVFWYPSPTITKYEFSHKLQVLAYHYLPAYIIDATARLFGKNPHMVKINQKIWRGIESLFFFLNQEWVFSAKKTDALFKQLSPKDQDLFNFDMSDMDWAEYLDSLYVGVKTYVIKDPGNSEVTNLHRMHLIKRISDFIFYAGLFFICLKIFKIYPTNFVASLCTFSNYILYLWRKIIIVDPERYLN